MADDIGGALGGLENHAQNIANEIGGDVNEVKSKIRQLAQEHGLDPNHVENWPQDIKDKIKQEA